MMNEELYRRLAAVGNASAQEILDTADAMPELEGDGAVPAEEMSTAESETDELEGMRDLSEKVGGLAATAAVHSHNGHHAKAGDAHFELGQVHEGSGDHLKAKDAFKSAATSYKKELDGCASMSPEQIQAWHAKSAVA